jgi:phage shock protein A
MKLLERLFGSARRPQTCGCEDESQCTDPQLEQLEAEHRQLEARLKMLKLSAEVKSHLHGSRNAGNSF